MGVGYPVSHNKVKKNGLEMDPDWKPGQGLSCDRGSEGKMYFLSLRASSAYDTPGQTYVDHVEFWFPINDFQHMNNLGALSVDIKPVEK